MTDLSDSESAVTCANLTKESLQTMKRAELQAVMKQLGLKGGNKKASEMIAIITAHRTSNILTAVLQPRDHNASHEANLTEDGEPQFPGYPDLSDAGAADKEISTAREQTKETAQQPELDKENAIDEVVALAGKKKNKRNSKSGKPVSQLEESKTSGLADMQSDDIATANAINVFQNDADNKLKDQWDAELETNEANKTKPKRRSAATRASKNKDDTQTTVQETDVIMNTNVATDLVRHDQVEDSKEQKPIVTKRSSRARIKPAAEYDTAMAESEQSMKKVDDGNTAAEYENGLPIEKERQDYVVPMDVDQGIADKISNVASGNPEVAKAAEAEIAVRPNSSSMKHSTAAKRLSMSITTPPGFPTVSSFLAQNNMSHLTTLFRNQDLLDWAIVKELTVDTLRGLGLTAGSAIRFCLAVKALFGEKEIETPSTSQVNLSVSVDSLQALMDEMANLSLADKQGASASSSSSLSSGRVNSRASLLPRQPSNDSLRKQVLSSRFDESKIPGTPKRASLVPTAIGIKSPTVKPRGSITKKPPVPLQTKVTRRTTRQKEEKTEKDGATADTKGKAAAKKPSVSQYVGKVETKGVQFAAGVGGDKSTAGTFKATPVPQVKKASVRMTKAAAGKVKPMTFGTPAKALGVDSNPFRPRVQLARTPMVENK